MQTSEHRLDTAQGQLHARQWRPDAARHLSPIMLFHDSLGCVALWRDFPQRLAETTGRTVIAYDRLGFGNSDPHPGRLSPDFVESEALTAFQQVRAQLGIERFIAFGHSVGGGMATACAGIHAADCDGLVTEAAQAFVEDRTIAGIQEAQRGFTQPGQLDRLSKYHGDKAAWVLSAWVDTWLSPEFADWNLDAALPRVQCPVLAIHGALDEYGSPRHPQRIADLSAGPATVEILDGCGHVPHKEMADAVLSLVDRWLQRQDPAASNA